MTKFKLPDLLLVVLFIIAYFAFSALKAPESDPSSDLFDITSAKTHLLEIADAPHPIGTKEHNKVANYIADYATTLGYQTTIVRDTLVEQWKCHATVATLNNILIQKKGTDSDGIIAFAAHYDSQPNTHGAADDGSAIAVMLSLMEKYEGVETKNDILFLVTDGEETGLLGAKAFVSNSPLAQEIKYLFNFEARGNSGPILGFEPNDNNNATVSAFSKMIHNYGNSLMYEIYKIMPNDTDFTNFKKLDIGGIGFAMIGGYVNYHSMTDNPQNIDENSVFHQGVLMALLLNSFANKELSEKHEYDLTYFNTWGSHMVKYKSYWNLLFVLLIVILLPVYVHKTCGTFQVKDMVMGFFLFLMMLIIPLAILFLVNFCILWIYPQYSNFYSHNYYNSIMYFLPYLCIAIGSIFMLSKRRKTSRKLSLYAHYWAILTFSILGILSYIYMRSASYFLLLPLALFLLIQVGLLFLPKLQASIRDSLATLPIIILFAPLIYLFFIVFSLQLPYVAVFVCTIILFLLIPLLQEISEVWKWIFLWIIAMGCIRGHVTSFIAETQPLQANMYYQYDLDTETAELRSSDNKLDRFEQTVMKEAKLRSDNGEKPYYFSSSEMRIPSSTIVEEVKSSEDGYDKYVYSIETEDEIIKTIFSGSGIDQAEKIFVNGKMMDKGTCGIQYLGDVNSDGLRLEIWKKNNEETNKSTNNALRMSFIQRGLIEKVTNDPTIIPGTGFYGGTIIHTRRWSL